MSEHITWESCPRCGRPAAVGWNPAGGAREDPVEFDCPAGCQLSTAQVRAAFIHHRATGMITAR